MSSISSIVPQYLHRSLIGLSDITVNFGFIGSLSPLVMHFGFIHDMIPSISLGNRILSFLIIL